MSTAFSPVLIGAHRGASRAARENTIEAFRKAAALRADLVELDVRVSAGALIVHHDPLPDGRPPYAPTLDEALNACAGMLVNIEIKNDPREYGFERDGTAASAVASLLTARAEPLDRWIVSSFDPNQIEVLHRLAPAIPTGVLYSRALLDDAVLVAQTVSAGHRALHPHHSLVTDSLVDLAHRNDLAVNVWTVDEPERIRQLAELGVDCIITNVPDLARRVIEGLGRTLLTDPNSDVTVR